MKQILASQIHKNSFKVMRSVAIVLKNKIGLAVKEMMDLETNSPSIVLGLSVGSVSLGMVIDCEEGKPFLLKKIEDIQGKLLKEITQEVNFNLDIWNQI